MYHRHLNHQNFTLAAIDDCISRGVLKDWRELREACKEDPLIPEKIKKVCLSRIQDPYQQRYHLWFNYVQKRTSQLG